MNMNKLNNFFEPIPEKLRMHKKSVLLLFVLLVILLSSGLPRLQLDMTLESFFSDDDPTKIAYNEFRDTFGSDETVLIVFEARKASIFSPSVLKVIQDVQEALISEDIPPDSPLQHITRTTSIINVKHLKVDQDTLAGEAFLSDTDLANPTILLQRQKTASGHPDYPLTYFSKDLKYGGIVVRTDLGEQVLDNGTLGFKTPSMDEYVAMVESIETLLAQDHFRQGVDYHLAGNPVMMAEMGKLVKELEPIFMALFVLIIIVLAAIFRSISAVFLSVGLILMTFVLAFGTLGWLGVKQDIMVNVLFLLVFVVGIADSVHILSGYLHHRRNGQAHKLALSSAFKKSGLACVLTSLTTMCGMLSLLFVPIQSIQIFGLSAALSILFALMLTLFILPLFMDFWPPVSQRHLKLLGSKAQYVPLIQKEILQFQAFSLQKPVLMIALFLTIGAISVVGLSRVQIDSNMIEVLDDSLPIKQVYSTVDQVMGGTQSMEIFLSFEREGALQNPEVLNAMESLQSTLEARTDLVTQTYSLVNVAKESFQALNEGQSEFFRIPQRSDELAQTLLLFDMANPDDRALLVSDDYSTGRITVRMYNAGSQKNVAFFHEVEEHLNLRFASLQAQYPEMELQITGGFALMRQLVEYISWSQIKSFSLALIVITGLLFIIFGSLRLGLVAILPNIFPVLTTFGVMGFLGFPLDTDTLVIAPIIIGLAVDDTIHFLNHYQSDIAETHRISDAIKASSREVGQAIAYTSIIIAIGFLALAFSSHQGLAHFGILTSVAVMSALVADLLFLPALILAFPKSMQLQSHTV